MQIKECYVSHNGISCFTNINSLVNIKDIELKSIENNNNIINNVVNKNSLIFYISLRVSEFIIKDFIKNKFYLFDSNYIETNLLPAIMFS